MDALFSTDRLAAAIAAKSARVVDARYTSTVPGAPASDPRADFAAGHIPGALFLDLDTLKDSTNPLPSMLPPEAAFVDRLRALGIGNGDPIVLYDAGGHHTACRAWWVMRMFGVTDVALLDGGLPKWRAEGRPLEQGMPTPAPGSFVAAGRATALRTRDQLLANLASGAEQVVDARSRARFTGGEPDPRPGAASGHIPGSANLPYDTLFNADGTWKRRDDIAALFAAAGVTFDRPLVASCGSGITAAVLAFAAHLLGHDAAIYDGSWSEWGSDPATPKATGA